MLLSKMLEGGVKRTLTGSRHEGEIVVHLLAGLVGRRALPDFQG